MIFFKVVPSLILILSFPYSRGKYIVIMAPELHDIFSRYEASTWKNPLQTLNNPTTFCNELKESLNIVSLNNEHNFDINDFLEFKISEDSTFKSKLEKIRYPDSGYVFSLPCPLTWATVYITKNTNYDDYILFAKDSRTNTPRLIAVVKEHLLFMKTGENVIRYFKNFQIENPLDNIERTWLCTMCIWHLRNRVIQGKIQIILSEVHHSGNNFEEPSTLQEIPTLSCMHYKVKLFNERIEYAGPATHKILVYSEGDEIIVKVMYKEFFTIVSYNQSLFMD